MGFTKFYLEFIVAACCVYFVVSTNIETRSFNRVYPLKVSSTEKFAFGASTATLVSRYELPFFAKSVIIKNCIRGLFVNSKTAWVHSKLKEVSRYVRKKSLIKTVIVPIRANYPNTMTF